MAMPGSGCIALRTCITGIACSSIACAVNGSAVGSCSLSALSVSAGKTAPHAMTEFYGYSPAPPTINLNIQPISVSCGPTTICCCGCLQPSNAVPAGDCYYPNYTWCLCASNANVTSALVCIRCNNVQIYCCALSGKAYSQSGSWITTARRVDSNDLIHIVTCVDRGVLNDCVRSQLVLSSITQCVGTYCVGSPNRQSSEYGIIPE